MFLWIFADYWYIMIYYITNDWWKTNDRNRFFEWYKNI